MTVEEPAERPDEREPEREDVSWFTKTCDWLRAHVLPERYWLKGSWERTSEFLKQRVEPELEDAGDRELLRERWFEEAKHYDQLSFRDR